MLENIVGLARKVNEVLKTNRKLQKRNALLQERLESAVYNQHYFLKTRGKYFETKSKIKRQSTKLLELSKKIDALRLHAVVGSGKNKRLILRLSQQDIRKLNQLLSIDFRRHVIKPRGSDQ